MSDGSGALPRPCPAVPPPPLPPPPPTPPPPPQTPPTPQTPQTPTPLCRGGGHISSLSRERERGAGAFELMA